MADEAIPVFLDTDIGGDIDDTWALAFLLNCPEVSLKSVLTYPYLARYRAKIVGKLLEYRGRSDVTVCVSDFPMESRDAVSECIARRQAGWVEDYRLEDYPGEVREDGIAAFVDGILSCPGTPTVLGIGPLHNIARALELAPSLASKCRFVGIFGSIRKGYFGSSTPSNEYNVLVNPAAARAVFSASWQSITLSPLDTCGYVYLDGLDYQRLRESDAPMARAVIENYSCWNHPDATQFKVRSSLICDTVGAYLTFDESLVTIESLPIRVTDSGGTVIDPEAGVSLRVATGWKDLEGFKKLLVERLDS